MANSVDAVIGSEAIKQVENLIAKLNLADAELIKISQSANTASKGISSISTPSGLSNSVNQTNELNKKLEKQNEIITKLHADIAKKAEQSRLAEIRLQQQREKAFDSYEKGLQKENALNAKNETAYQRIQNSVNLLTKSYQDLAIRKQLGGNLTEKEEKQLVSLTNRIKTYQEALLATDAQIGKNQRNVGNYASGFNGLGNSINQITRELPAFTFSAQTGFLALSNNIPILTDEIGKLVARNKELKASGQETTSVFKQILGGVFSLQTAMGVGILLFTLYGKEISAFFSTLFKGKDTIKSLAENQKLLNDTLKESSGSYAQEKVNIEVLYKTATNLNASYKDRKRAVDELQELYPFYFKNLTDEAIMTGQAKDQYNLLSQAIITVAKARASEEILQKRESERLVIEQEQIDLTMKKYKELANAKGTTTYVSGGGSVAGSGTQSIGETKEQQQSRLRREIQEIRLESIKQRNDWAKEDAFFIEKIAQGNAIEQTLKPFEKAKKEKVKKEKEARREDVEALEIHIKKIGTLVDEINKEIERLETEKIVANADELPSVNFQLEQLKTLKQQINGIPTVDFKINAPVKQEDVELVKEMSESVKNYLNSFSSEFMSNSGFSETFDLLSGNIEDFGENFAVTFNAIAESAQEAFNFISNASQANFEQENARVQAQYETALKYAGEGTLAEAKLKEDLEKRKKDIANRENKAKQKQALFNIAIDIAQGITSALATGNIPLSIIIGALGAVQLGLVASQKIPQYFEGTDNHQGGLMLVNDGKGANFQEKIILPNGREIMPEGRNVLMNAPAGTKVLTHEQQIQQMLNERGISMSANYAQSNGMTAQEMDAVLGKHFANIQTNHTSIDKNGLRVWAENNGNKTIRVNNRVSRTGFNV